MTSRKMSLLQAKKELKEIFYAAVESVKPSNIIENKVRVDENNLYIENKRYSLQHNIYVTGFGKGVTGMAITMEKLLGDRLIKGIVSVPRGTMNLIQSDESSKWSSKQPRVISYQENSIDNQPDDDTLITTRNIVDMVKCLGADDTLIVLISGGGSALLSMPHAIISVEKKLNLCQKLFKSGANIKEINKIRQNLSMVKGGGLARMAYPASVIGLILSDIIGDPIELIASGPTVYCPKAPDDLIEILQKYNIFDEIDEELRKFLLSTELHNEKVFVNNENTNEAIFEHVHNIIVSNNLSAIEAAKFESLRQNLNPIILFNNVQGLVSDVSLMYSKICYLICKIMENSISKDDFISSIKSDSYLSVLIERMDEIYATVQMRRNQGLVLIGGGEPTVIVKGNGKGGRNQELALRFSIDWHNIIKENPQLEVFNVVFLSAGTDGQDGPTDAAGAFGYSKIYSDIAAIHEETNEEYKANISKSNNATVIEEIRSMIPENILKNNDSYTFYSRFKNGTDLLKTGITGTNVMDLHLIHIKTSECHYEHNNNDTEHIFKST